MAVVGNFPLVVYDTPRHEEAELEEDGHERHLQQLGLAVPPLALGRTVRILLADFCLASAQSTKAGFVAALHGTGSTEALFCSDPTKNC